MIPNRSDFKWSLWTTGDSEGFPLLWLHGFMGSSSDWQTLASRFFPEYCNIMVDLPGHGQSFIAEGDQYGALFDNLHAQLADHGFDTFIPVGYSMGGRIALHFQQRFPGSMPALVTLSTAPGLITAREQQQRRSSDVQLMNNLDQLGFTTFLNEWYALPLFQSICNNEYLLKSLMHSRSNNDPDQLRKSIDLLGNGSLPSLWEKLPDMDLPILMISGSLDSKYNLLNEKMLRLFPQAKHQVIQDGDHAFYLEKPLETAHLIRQFLSQIIEGEHCVNN